jgi:hypothetical protein
MRAGGPASSTPSGVGPFGLPTAWAVSVPPATRSKVGRAPRFSSAGALPDGCACMDNPGPASNPCNACSVPIRGWALPLAGGRCRGARSGVCHSRGTGLQGSDSRRSGRHRGQGTVALDLCIPACADSKQRRPTDQLPSAIPRRAPPNAGSTRHKCSRGISCPSGKNASEGLRSASRYGLGFLPAGTQGAGAAGHSLSLRLEESSSLGSGANIGRGLGGDSGLVATSLFRVNARPRKPIAIKLAPPIMSQCDNSIDESNPIIFTSPSTRPVPISSVCAVRRRGTLWLGPTSSTLLR